jgi:hypothetical protein
LTTSQLDNVLGLWRLAGLAPTTGYGAAILAMSVASNHVLAATLTSVDLDDTTSLACAVRTLKQWRQGGEAELQGLLVEVEAFVDALES